MYKIVTYLFAISASPSGPLVKTRSPIIDHHLLDELLTRPVAVPTLTLDGRHCVRTLQVDLQILSAVVRYHALRTPRTTVIFPFQPIKTPPYQSIYINTTQTKNN